MNNARTDQPPAHLREPLRTAISRWDRRGRPDGFSISLKDEAEQEVHIFVYHHETFPRGGQLFTADVRNSPDQYAPNSLLHRERIQSHPGEPTGPVSP